MKADMMCELIGVHDILYSLLLSLADDFPLSYSYAYPGANSPTPNVYAN